MNDTPITITESGPVETVESLLTKAIGYPPESVTLAPKPKGPTAAESLKKQREADKLARLEKATTPDSTKPVKAKEKPVSKTVTKKKPVAKKAATKPSENGHVSTHAKKTGLRTMQLRALAVLTQKEFKDGLTIADLAKKAKISSVVMQRGIGAISPEKRVEHDASNGFKSLLTMKYVTTTKVEGDNIIAATDKGVAKYKEECPDGTLPKKHPSRYSTLKGKPNKKK